MAVKALLHYALEVPDQTVGETFYRDFGLATVSARDEAVHLRPQPLSRDVVRLYPGPKKRLRYVAFGAPGAELEATRESLRRAGVGEVDAPKGVADAGGLWVRDPDGNLVNVRDEAQEIGTPEPPLRLNSPGQSPRVGARGYPEPAPPRPRRLGHVLLFTPDIDRQVDFYQRALGMKLSDRAQSIVAFMRCTSDHHNLAFLTSTGPGFHHGSFEVGSIDEIAMNAAAMQDRGWKPGWGLGRHVIGSNFFFYMRDPWGSFAEYFHDIDCIPEGCAWEARNFPPEDSLYRWGPPVPEDFGLNREVE
jgi:catechol 2,3-dioxygenase-like lactoylglutathione lyase family enzyme